MSTVPVQAAEQAHRSSWADRSQAGRAASVLLVVAGCVTMASVLLPEPSGFDGHWVFAVGAAGTALGLVVLILPWHRWPSPVSLVLMAPALALITLHNWFGGSDPYRYSIFFLVAYVWLGMFHPRGTSLLFAVPTAVAYLVPLVAAGRSTSALASAGYAVPVYVLAGEILAWRTAVVHRLEDDLRAAALHDPLTGLPNRRLAIDRLEAALARADRTGGFVHVLYLDVDRFKTINDTYGHDAGDGVLITLADTLSGTVRPCDTVSRLAGDEFIVLVESAGADDGTATAHRILDALRTRDLAGPPALVPTVSIGVASSAGDSSDAATLLRAADAALYAAKQAGRDRAVRSEEAQVA